MGEIPLALVALTRLDEQRAGEAQLGAASAGQPYNPAESGLQKYPRTHRISLAFRYREWIS